MKCPKCGNENQSDAIFCDQCGQRLTQPEPAQPQVAVVAAPPAGQAGICAQCGAANTPGEMFCSECGAPLEAPAPEALAVAAGPAPAPAAAEPQALACPRCGAQAEPGDAFCAKCGAALTALPAAPEPVPEQPAAATPVTVVGPASATTPAPEPAAPVEAVTTQPVQSQAAAAPAPSECPSCGAHVEPDAAFCDFCGAALVGAVAATAAAAAPVAAQAASPATPVAVTTPPVAMAAPSAQPTGPYLLVAESGAIIPLSGPGEVLVGREDPLSSTFPDVDLTPHGGEEGGVSRRHLKITVGEGQFAIQDLNSTNSTWLNRTRLQPGLPEALHDGDEIRAGKVKLVFRAG